MSFAVSEQIVFEGRSPEEVTAMSAPIVSLVTFIAVALTVAGVYSILSDLFLSDRSRIHNRVDDEFRRKQRHRAERSNLFRNLAQSASEADTVHVDHPSRWRRFSSMVEQSGLDITPRKVLLISLTFGTVLGAMFFVIRPILLLGALGFLAGAVLPIFYVSQKKKARLEKLRSQLPQAFDLMARVIRAGQTMSQALLAVADEFTPPIAAEFSYCYEQQNLGLPPEEAYKDLSRRTDLVEVKLFVLAILVQQQTGGNLAELLDKLSSVLRERFRLRGVVATLTAEGRMQAMILMALPPTIFLMIMVLNPQYGKQLFLYPQLIGITLGSQLMGALWIRKIVNFEY